MSAERGVPPLLRRPWTREQVLHSLADAVGGPDHILRWFDAIDQAEFDLLPDDVKAAIAGYVGAVTRLTITNLRALQSDAGAQRSES